MHRHAHAGRRCWARRSAVEREVGRLRPRYARVAVAYTDCGIYKALDDVCARLAVQRLPGIDCYEVFAGAARMCALLAAEPGTYVLTDYLATSFHRSVVVELGLDWYTELRDDYFGHYRRVVWLAPDRPAPARRRSGRRVSWAGGWRRRSSSRSCSSRPSTT